MLAEEGQPQDRAQGRAAQDADGAGKMVCGGVGGGEGRGVCGKGV